MLEGKSRKITRTKSGRDEANGARSFRLIIKFSSDCRNQPCSTWKDSLSHSVLLVSKNIISQIKILMGKLLDFDKQSYFSFTRLTSKNLLNLFLFLTSWRDGESLWLIKNMIETKQMFKGSFLLKIPESENIISLWWNNFY